MTGTTRSVISYILSDIYSICRLKWYGATYKSKDYNGKIEILCGNISLLSGPHPLRCVGQECGILYFKLNEIDVITKLTVFDYPFDIFLM